MPNLHHGNTALLWSQAHQVVGRLKLWVTPAEITALMAAMQECIEDDAAEVQRLDSATAYRFPDDSILMDSHGVDRHRRREQVGYEITISVRQPGDGTETRYLLQLLARVQTRAVEMLAAAQNGTREDGS